MSDESNRIDRITSHFEEEAQEYDNIISRLIPNYQLMVESLISVIPFDTNRKFSVIDLGCGTGTISKAVKEQFPNINITCVDIAKNMLEIASEKIGGEPHLIHENFYEFHFPQKYDLIVSSLALHHLETDSDKLDFYNRIYAALNDNGLFINIDVVLGSDQSLTNIYIEKWKSFMYQNTAKEEVLNLWLPNYYAEDRPAPLVSHLAMLEQSGFSCVDVVYKHYNYAVYLAKKMGKRS